MKRKRIKWGCLIPPIIMLLIIPIAERGYYYTRPDSWGPVSREELCEALDRDVENDPLCHSSSQDDYGQEFEELQLLLENSFPLGIATREQVKDQLADYHRFSYEITHEEGKYRDYFAVRRARLIKNNCWVASFTFDENGILLKKKIHSEFG